MPKTSVIYDDGFRQLVCFAFEPCPLRTLNVIIVGFGPMASYGPKSYICHVFDSGIEHDFECVVAQVVDPVLPIVRPANAPASNPSGAT